MRLDLSKPAVLEPARRDALNSIALEARQPFNKLIRQLSAPHGDNIDWWVTPVASRNVFSCALFLRCCQLLLAVRAVDNSEAIREIIVESPGLAAVLRRKLADRHSRVSIRTRRNSLWWHTRLLAGMCFRWAAAAYHAAGQWLCSRLVRPQPRPVPRDPITLVDTFVYRDSFTHGYRDRHYPGLLEGLDEAQRRRVFLLPTYYKIKNYVWLFRTLRASKVNFLLKEDWLGLGDYAYALAHPFRLLGFTIEECDFEGTDIAPMVNEALYESFAAAGSILGLLRYRLAERLRDARVPVSGMIDWFENQEIDHGSNAGFRRFLPETRITGYQGFVVSRHYLCMFPTRDEMRLGLIPHRVAVTGRALVNGIKEFCPDLEVCEAPAFRFSGLWRAHKARRDPTPFTILVALPLMPDESTEVLELVNAAGFSGSAGGAGWRILIKRHPTADARLPLDARLEASDGSIDDLLEDCDVLVSNASSACVQALARGVPVVVLGNSRGITLNPIPDGIDRELWAVCHTPAQLTAALHVFAQRDPGTIARHRQLGAAIREQFFTPVTREAVASLLMLGDAADTTRADTAHETPSASPAQREAGC